MAVLRAALSARTRCVVLMRRPTQALWTCRPSVYATTRQVAPTDRTESAEVLTLSMQLPRAA